LVGVVDDCHPKKSLGKVEKILQEMKDKKYKKSLSAANALKSILPQKYLKVFDKDIAEGENKWTVKLSKNYLERKAYEQSFGKTVLFTNNFDSSPAEIAESYRPFSLIEDQFKLLHNTFMVSSSSTQNPLVPLSILLTSAIKYL